MVLIISLSRDLTITQTKLLAPAVNWINDWLKVKRDFRVKIHHFGSILCQFFDWLLVSDYIFILPYYLDNNINTYQASE